MKQKFSSSTERLQAVCAGVWGSEKGWWGCLVVLSLTALCTRLVYLEYPPGTTWDEVHFGGFGNHYLNRTFFHDVHPPLGKMLVAGAMKMAGFDTSFPFSVNTLYPQHLHYAALRGVFGVLGASMVPLAFLTVWCLTASLPASVLAGTAILTDHFLHRISTLVLLDAPLLVAILASVSCSFCFHATSSRNYIRRSASRPWSVGWWLRLSATGVSLGVVMSIKYIGAFTVVFVGLHTAYQLCCIIADPHQPWWMAVPHFCARAACLMVLPAVLYLSSFVLHFAVLSSWQPGEGAFYHTRFVTSMRNTEFDDKFFPKYLDYGANVTLKNSMAMSGYLESWFDLFPSEFTAACQQVTLSAYTDPEAVTWTVRYVNASGGQVEDVSSAPGAGGHRVVRSGDHLVLTHRETGRSLRSHGHRAAVTRRHYQACGYGDDYSVGPFETWQILIPGAAPGTPLEPLRSEFMLKHYVMECYLANPDNTPLPRDWAYETSKEVTCTKNALSSGLLWHLSWVNSTRLPLTQTPSDHAMSLWEKILEQHRAMVLGNQGLKPQQEELLQSVRPWMWPLMFRLQLLSNYNKEDVAEHRRRATDKNLSSRDPAASDLDKTGSKNEENVETSGNSTLKMKTPGVGDSSSEKDVGNKTQVQPQPGKAQSNSSTTRANATAIGASSEDPSIGVLAASSKIEVSGSVSGANSSRSASSKSALGFSNLTNLESADENPNQGSSDSKNTTSVPAQNDVQIATRLHVPMKQNKKPATEMYAIFMNNPVLAYANLLGFALTLLLVGYHLYKLLRDDNEPAETFARRRVAVVAAGWLSTCWAVHYLPFFFMSRILYVHHYCPAYLYSCMLTGVVLSYMCEATAVWLCPSRKDLLMSAFLCLPVVALLTSYFALFPLATYIEGRFAFPHPQLNKYLDMLHAGQHWVEFGYKIENYESSWATSMIPVEQQSWDNPDVNASLYYLTPLETRPVQNPHVDPVPSSNYSAWVGKELHNGSSLLGGETG